LELKGDQRITELENRFAVEFLAHLSLMEWEHIGATEDCPPHFLDSSKVSSPTGSAKTCEYLHFVKQYLPLLLFALSGDRLGYHTNGRRRCRTCF
jgi:hypothetical protein